MKFCLISSQEKSGEEVARGREYYGAVLGEIDLARVEGLLLSKLIKFNAAPHPVALLETGGGHLHERRGQGLAAVCAGGVGQIARTT